MNIFRHTMKKIPVILLILVLVLCLLGFRATFASSAAQLELVEQKDLKGKEQIILKKAGETVISTQLPIQILLATDRLALYSQGYDSLKKDRGDVTGYGSLKVSKNLSFHFNDYWTILTDGFQIEREVRVIGTERAGFASRIMFTPSDVYTKNRTCLFVPGMIYGDAQFLPTSAIGGTDNFKGSKTNIFIREDRMSAPLFGIYFTGSHHSLALLNPSPNGQTTEKESHNLLPTVLTDARFQFGSIGVQIEHGSLRIGYCYPGNEGEITYKGDIYPGGHLKQWRRRFHPVIDGFTHTYCIRIIVDSPDSFSSFYTEMWREAWKVLNPNINRQNISLIKRSILTALASQVELNGRYSGLPNWVDAYKGGVNFTDRKAVLGFTGKNLESARFLLRGADEKWNRDSVDMRKKALNIIASFLNIKMNPPAATGFNLDNGAPVIALPHKKQIYLRSLGDGFKALAYAYLDEQRRGKVHKKWLNWMKKFAGWLLNQQNEKGGFPRSWQPSTGLVAEKSTLSSYQAVPFLILLTQITGQSKYLDAAIKAAEVSWTSSQKYGQFIGGTIDNPNVLDKEAATLSLEAYLLLYEHTGNKKWLVRSKTAANFAETWIYIWNVPMPIDESNHLLQWKKGNSTVGLQLISTGHSLVDMYMAFNADEFAKLYRYTGDNHYLQVARILLHNTKAMTAISGREFDLRGAGWQQEHWSLAPPRGFGLHRGWLPWVATSQLNGIYGIEDLGDDLKKKLLWQ